MINNSKIHNDNDNNKTFPQCIVPVIAIHLLNEIQQINTCIDNNNNTFFLYRTKFILTTKKTIYKNIYYNLS